jgi:hypothetical protein
LAVVIRNVAAYQDAHFAVHVFRLLSPCGWGGVAFVGAGGSATLDQTSVTAILTMGGLAGAGGSDGDGFGGGLYVATGATVSLKKSNVAGNYASTSNDEIYGTVTYL